MLQSARAKAQPGKVDLQFQAVAQVNEKLSEQLREKDGFCKELQRSLSLSDENQRELHKDLAKAKAGKHAQVIGRGWDA